MCNIVGTGYLSVGRKTESLKVFFCPSHRSTVRCMTGHVKYVLRGSLHHVVFHIGTI